MLSRQQRDELEDAALRAVGGSLRRDAAGGAVVLSSSGTAVVSLHWSGLAPRNEVEIAVCDSRLSDRYEVFAIHCWVAVQKARWPAACVEHDGCKGWPCFGLTFAQALEFLRALFRLRRGLLGADERQAMAAVQASQPAEEAAQARARAELADLLPSRHYAVYDLLRQAGVDVSAWSRNAAGEPVVAPRSNPAHCYNWSFGGDGQPRVACLWHGSFGIKDGRIVGRGNYRQLARELDEVAQRPAEQPEVKMRARTQASRARAVDALIAAAAADDKLLRVIVNEGQMRSESSLGYDSSDVKVRKLDVAPWRVEQYDPDTGAFAVVRAPRADAPSVPPQEPGTAPPVREAEVAAPAPAPAPSGPAQARYADQFTEGADVPERRESSGTSYARDPAVRARVLERAQGCCEFCGVPGFVTRSGSTYLETHHVVPLAEGGADRAWNVVALCPNDHRQAHFGERAAGMREQLLAHLRRTCPRDEDASLPA